MYRKSVLALPSLAVILLPGCEVSTEPRVECPAQSHTLGRVVQGTLTRTDCRWLADDQFADYYEIVTITEGSLAVTLEDGDRRMGVAIINAAGEVLDQRYANPGLSVSASRADLPPGTYFAVVIGYHEGESGTYTFTSSTTGPGAPEPFFGCVAAEPYIIGLSITGTLTNNGCLSDTGQNFDLHRFTIGAGRTIAFTLESPPDRDPFIYLFDDEGTVISTQDASGTGANPSEVLVLTLPPGTYYIGASDYQYAATGAYSLRSH